MLPDSSEGRGVNGERAGITSGLRQIFGPARNARGSWLLSLRVRRYDIQRSFQSYVGYVKKGN
jgi:hypothetical protein